MCQTRYKVTFSASSSTGRFFPTHITLQSEEDTRAYENTYTFVKDTLGEAPKARMAGAAKKSQLLGKRLVLDESVLTIYAASLPCRVVPYVR